MKTSLSALKRAVLKQRERRLGLEVYSTMVRITYLSTVNFETVLSEVFIQFSISILN